MKITARNIACGFLLLVAVAGIACAKGPKLATKQYADSTIFTLKLVPGAKPAVGKSFKVKIHVTPRHPYHVWSAEMDDNGGLYPLKVSIPDSLADFFELTAFKELGKPESAYDSNFSQVTKSFSEPFDVMATIMVKKNAPAPKPFYLWVTYSCCDGKTKCFPPMKYNVPMDVIGDKPLELNIAEGVKRNAEAELALGNDRR
jgi:hypothetical protein